MISETLAGTNVGVSEAGLSDTSPSNQNPLNGAIAEMPGDNPAADKLASQAGGPRQGWWKRRSPEDAISTPALTQIGGEGVCLVAKTTTPDLVADFAGTASTLALGGGAGDELRANNDQDVVSQAEGGTTPALPTNGFAGLGLSDQLLKAVEQSGYTTPTPIQFQGIPPVLQHRDIIGIAQTGTGKTASFTLPMIELLARGRPKARMPRSLILEPTRELAAQVAESFAKYGKYNKLSMALLIGGTSFDDQDKKLDRGVDVLIATPGRLLDHFERGKLMLSQVQILVVDEADRMLDMGFIPDVERICKLIPFTRQTLFYSATMPPEIRRLTEQFLHNPVKVEVARPATTAENITQEAVDVPANDWAKREALRRLIRENAVGNAIVFCNRKRDVDVVARSLSKHGFNAAPLHGDLDQSVRTRTLDGFRSGAVQILVASDVAARGLDIPAVSHIFNFDVPYHPDDYVHRIGRTGRAGRSGHAYMLVTPRDAKYMEAIERLIGKALRRHTLHGLADAVRAQPKREHSARERGSHRGFGHRHSPPRRDESKHQSVPVSAASPKAQPSDEHHNRPAHKPHAQRERSGHASSAQPATSAERKPDALQLPAFLLRPVPVPKSEPKSEKPVTTRKRTPVTA